MRKRIIAFCGICCSDCPAYRATLSDDENLRREVAEKWSSAEFPICEKDVVCYGCAETDKEVMPFVSSCKVRSCAMAKGVDTCAHCDEYSCDILEYMWDRTGDERAKTNLDNIRRHLAEP
jgi:hypothetical protein